MTTSYDLLMDLLYAEKRYGLTAGALPTATVSSLSVSDAQRYCATASVDPAVLWLESAAYLNQQYMYANRTHDGMEIRPMFEVLLDHECPEAEGGFAMECAQEWGCLQERRRGPEIGMVITDEAHDWAKNFFQNGGIGL